LIQTQQELTVMDRGFEFMMNALRLSGGFDTALFQERTGLPIRAVQKQLDEAEQRGLLVYDHLRIKPTVLGKRFLNDLLQIFLPESNAG
jgi:oxygen-independent coproporphyrinogen-3 oxidase